jgi:glycosyltransferase involved in cell wall biosynthesis
LRKEGGKRFKQGPRATAPLVSIISVVYRDSSALVPLMESIFSHASSDAEIIVIDGGSCDGTLDLLQRWSDKIDYWLSEKDAGLYDAMNKGISAATGEYILHLNAGDDLCWIPSSHLMQCKADQVDVVCFDVLIDKERVFHPATGFLMRIANTWHHQGTFYRRSRHPGYDTRYRVYSDFDVNQKLYRSGCKIRIFPGTVAGFSTGGISSSDARKEIYSIVRKNYGLLYLPIAFARFQRDKLRSALSST